ncbi:MAG TPA: DNA polymerase III subunit gamma/tau [Ktedonobacteraceae bacterium]|nr:DNA polymerase III subunit gamma/tau [Ktedonobacteraceae bacterium]
MASQSLYRKWRSQSFGDMVGQEPVIRTLKNALSSGKLAHAYLFTGPRGTGKTTTARLLAKTINCEHPIDGEPCNQCQQCREITAGNSFNVIEIDAASNRGIDSIRDLRDKVMMPPSTGKYKVYVLDEAHMLTTEAFNALLKTLEEPPDYAIFVMATTDVHKMLPTVLSRCQRFDFKRFTTRQIVEHLNFVAEQEHIKIERGAAELIARAAAGGMRDALSLLDQAIAYSGDEISLTQVQAMLGVADPRAIQKLMTHVAELNSADGLHLIHELSEAGADLRQLNIQVGEYWRSLMLAKAGADIGTILDRTEDEIREIQQMAKLFELEELTECARIFAQNDLMQKNQGTPQLGLELAFLQSIELHRRAQSGQSIVAPVATAQPQPQPQSPSRPVPPPAVQRSSTPQEIHRSPAPAQRSSPPSQNGREADSLSSEPIDEYPASVYEEEEVPFVAQTPVSSQEHAPKNGDGVGATMATNVSGPTPTPTLEQVQDAWENIKKRIKQKNSQTSALLNYYTVVAVDASVEPVLVVIQARTKVFYDHMQKGDRVKHAEWGLGMEFQRKFRVQLLLPDQTLPPPPVNRSPTITPPVAPQQSAHRGRPPSPPSPPSSRQSQTGQNQPEARQYEAKAVMPGEAIQEVVPPVEVSDADQAAPIVKKGVVRENTTSVSASSSFESIKQKASSDPVVQEVMKTFTAKIVDIRPK